MQRSRSKPFLLVTLSLFGVLFVAVALLMPMIATSFALWLSLPERNLPPPEKVDTVIILAGNTMRRAEKAIELFDRFGASDFVITGYQQGKVPSSENDSIMAKDLAMTRHIPESAITLLPSVSTQSDAAAITTFLAHKPGQSVLIVTDWVHERRAFCTLQSMVDSNSGSVRWSASGAIAPYTEANWWQNRDGIADVFSETIKLAGYGLRYGISPWSCFTDDINFTPYIAMLVAGIVISTFIVRWRKNSALARNQLDLPNDRSSHTVPTPRGGGIGIVLGALGVWSIYLITLNKTVTALPALLGLMVGGGIVGVIGWLDDNYSLPIRLRLIAYTLISLFFVLANPFEISQTDSNFVSQIVLSIVILTIAVSWVLGLINIYNFMDGIDGLAAVQAIVASFFWVVILVNIGNPELAGFAIALLAASLGFLIYNAPPARIFMGDVGSTFLGFSFAALPLVAYSVTQRSRLLVCGAIFVLPFIADASITLITRAMSRKNVFMAHREHLYQRLVISGHSHRTVTALYGLFCLVCGSLGLLFFWGTERAAVIAALLLGAFYALYLWTVYLGRWVSLRLQRHKRE